MDCVIVTNLLLCINERGCKGRLIFVYQNVVLFAVVAAFTAVKTYGHQK